jgi:hypothetical protein
MDEVLSLVDGCSVEIGEFMAADVLAAQNRVANLLRQVIADAIEAGWAGPRVVDCPFRFTEAERLFAEVAAHYPP